MSAFFCREAFRIARLFTGLFFFTLGVVMTIQANLGYAPWDVFHQGLVLHLHITMGQASIFVSFVIVAITVLMKEHVGFGTICNMISVGVFMDILLGLVPLMHGFVSGVVMMIGGLFVLSWASVLYIGAGYGAGPRDSLMVVITKRTGKPVGLCRGCLEGSVLFIGWLLGGYAGIGTVISVFGVGVAVQIVFTALRFEVKTIHQESCLETFLRYRNALSPAHDI